MSVARRKLPAKIIASRPGPGTANVSGQSSHDRVPRRFGRQRG